jgi:hypothetical protein
VKYGFIAKYRTIWPTRTMCRLLGVSSSGFYDWLGRPFSAHELENAQLLRTIKHSHETSDGTYGSTCGNRKQPGLASSSESNQDIPEATPADLEWHILEPLTSFPAAKTSILQRFPRQTLINS